eukprot:709357-Rhodomonas_salina.1
MDRNKLYENIDRNNEDQSRAADDQSIVAARAIAFKLPLNQTALYTVVEVLALPVKQVIAGPPHHLALCGDSLEDDGNKEDQSVDRNKKETNLNMDRDKEYENRDSNNEDQIMAADDQSMVATLATALPLNPSALQTGLLPLNQVIAGPPQHLALCGEQLVESGGFVLP